MQSRVKISEVIGRPSDVLSGTPVMTIALISITL